MGCKLDAKQKHISYLTRIEIVLSIKNRHYYTNEKNCFNAIQYYIN